MAASGVQSSPDWGKPSRGGNKTSATSRSPETKILRVPESGNLALSCDYCNSYKGPHVAGVDPSDGVIVRLFHPLTDIWAEHFRWEGPVLAGRTAIGRVTISVLGINHPDAVVVRQSLIQEGNNPLLRNKPKKLTPPPSCDMFAADACLGP